MISFKLKCNNCNKEYDVTEKTHGSVKKDKMSFYCDSCLGLHHTERCEIIRNKSITELICPECKTNRFVTVSTWYQHNNPKLNKGKIILCRECSEIAKSIKMSLQNLKPESKMVIHESCLVFNKSNSRCLLSTACKNYDYCLDVANDNKWSGWDCEFNINGISTKINQLDDVRLRGIFNKYQTINSYDRLRESMGVLI